MAFFSPKSLLPATPSRKVRFHSPLSVEECKARLSKSIIRKGFGKLEPGLAGTITRNHFTIRKNWDSRNSWKVTFEGVLMGDEQGTQIEGEYRIFELTEVGVSCGLIFMTVYVTGMLIALTIQFFQTWQFKGNPLPFCGTSLPFFIILPVFLFFTRAFQLAGRSGRESEEETLTKFMEKTLQARPISQNRKEAQ